jgi:hypothetical protein
MTFEQAVKRKHEYPVQSLFYEGVDFEIYITPEAQDDLNRYLTDFRNGGFDDNSAKKYSSNMQFTVLGIWTDGVDIIFKHLESKT